LFDRLVQKYFCKIGFLDSRENELILLGNGFDLSAHEIAEIYKSKWTIELFLSG